MPFLANGNHAAMIPVRLSSTATNAEQHTRYVLRRTVERFWAPFMQQKTGADLSTYRFRENLDAICMPGSDFTCHVNGALGGARVLEDFFILVLGGFDFVSVKLENKRRHSLSEAIDPCNFHGHYVLAHTRPFMGWLPSSSSVKGYDKQLHKTSFTASRAAPAPATADSGVQESHQLCDATTLRVPFTTHVEGGLRNNLLTHMVLRTPVLDIVSNSPVLNCPQTVKDCLKNPEALAMYVALRRARVKPSLLTDKVLLRSGGKNEQWASALGIL